MHYIKYYLEKEINITQTYCDIWVDKTKVLFHQDNAPEFTHPLLRCPKSKNYS